MGPKVTAIIQARMNSTRLPGKVMMEVMERPLLNFQIERLRFSKMIDNIIITTTVNKEDDPIIKLCQKEGLNFYQGSEDDVLDRYYQAAKKYNVNHIMRLTADCPLIQPDICDRIVDTYFDSGCDYVCTGETFAEGLDCEVTSFRVLSQAWQEAKLKSEREHVTLYIRNHPEKYRLFIVENKTDDSRYRLSVDEKEDYFVVNAILENLYKGSDDYFTIEKIKAFLNTNPEIYRLNSYIIRNEGLLKSLQDDERVV
jgi:spore coat polysaccharide biosynthesis protein SpsF